MGKVIIMGEQMKVYKKYMRIRWVFVLGGFDTEVFETSLKTALVRDDTMYLLIVDTILSSFRLKNIESIFDSFPHGLIDVEQLASEKKEIPQSLYMHRRVLWDSYRKIEKLYKLKVKEDENKIESNKRPNGPEESSL